MATSIHEPFSLQFWVTFFEENSVVHTKETIPPNKLLLHRFLQHLPERLHNYLIAKEISPIMTLREKLAEYLQLNDAIVVKAILGCNASDVYFFRQVKGSWVVHRQFGVQHIAGTFAHGTEEEVIGEIIDELREKRRYNILIEPMFTFRSNNIVPELKIIWCRGVAVLGSFNVQKNDFVIYRLDRRLQCCDFNQKVWDLLEIKCEAFKVEFYQRMLDLICEVAPKIMGRFDCNYGRTDFFVTNEYKFKLNEIQNHGRSNDILFPIEWKKRHYKQLRKYCRGLETL